MVNRPDARAELEDFERAILAFGGSLLAVATRLTRNRADAEDLVQDTLIKALRARAQYEPGTNLKAWLFRILRNTFINRFRRSGVERAVLDGAETDPLTDSWVGAETLRGARDPEGQALRQVVEREITRVLDTLPEEFRLVILLADVEGLSYREIADAVGCPPGTVMSRLHRGRNLVKAKLIEQATLLGIIVDRPTPNDRPDPAAIDGPSAPVALQAYREKRRAK